MLSFVVVGGGATGVEVVSEIAELCSHTLRKLYSKQISCNEVSITLVNSSPELLGVFDAKVRAYAQKILEKNSIKIMLNIAVKEVTPTSVILGDGTSIESENVIWTAGVKPNDLTTTGGVLPKDKGGRIITDKTFAVPGFPDIFAIGDISHFIEESARGLPMLAQVAVGEGSHLGKNISNKIKGLPLKPFYYLSKGEFVSLGQGQASGTIFGIHFYGKPAWFIWRTIYLFKFISTSKRFRIAFDWTMQLFSSRDITRAR
jgi:NADH dehydrogenase